MSAKWLRRIGLGVMGVLAGAGAIIGQILTDKFTLDGLIEDKSEKGEKEEKEGEE